MPGMDARPSPLREGRQQTRRPRAGRPRSRPGRSNYDVIIVGAGPAGIFAALELARVHPGLQVLLLEKGRDLQRRHCPVVTHNTECIDCVPCHIISGWGGAGAFSDGKLTLTPEVGGWLHEYIPRPELQGLIAEVDRRYLHYGAPEAVFGTDAALAREMKRRAAGAGLNFIPATIRHLGTENCSVVLGNMAAELRNQVEIHPLTPTRRILADDGRVAGVETADGNQYGARYVIVACGRAGAGWFADEARRLGLGLRSNPVDIGVRVEVPAVVMEPLTDALYESKLVYYSDFFDDQVRTFCVCPYGEVAIENNDGLITVNGHSYRERRTENTNFALLVSKMFTEPFNEPIRYGRYIASLANMLGDGVLVQRLGDLLNGRRSTAERIQKGMVVPTLGDAAPGDLSLVLPYRHLRSILEMLEAMDRLAPGVNSRHTLLYGAEVKFYSARLNLSPVLETEVGNFFAAGDGAGVTRGLVQASASGMWVARGILRREGKDSKL